MTSKSIVPDDVKIAAKRGFIRTTYQAYAATIASATISAAAVLSLIDNPDPKLLVATVLAAIVPPPLAGLASYFSITAKGIPSDYQAEIPDNARAIMPGGE